MKGFGVSHPYSPHHPLYGCRLKLLRAEEHFQNLQNSMHEFWERGPYEVLQEPSSVPNESILRVRLIEPPPLTWSPIIGDIVHNMRSALDHLAWQLVIRNGNEPTPRTQFPIISHDPFDREVNETKKQWENAQWNWNRQTEGMHHEVIGLLKEYQPYQRQDSFAFHPLYQLKELSNWDKHRELHLSTSRFVGPLAYLQKSSRQVTIQLFEVKPRRHLLEDGEEVARFKIIPYGPNAYADVHTKIMGDLAFGENSPLKGQWIAKTLHDIGYYVSAITLEFKKQFDETAPT